MNIEKEYLKPNNTPFNQDRYIVRKGIIKLLQDVLPDFPGTLLDVGCGFKPYRSVILTPPSRVKKYIGLDLHGNTYKKPDLAWDGEKIPLKDNSVENAMATEVLEHCSEPDTTLKEIHRVLKPQGRIFFTVPFLWPLHDMPYDYYRYTPKGLEHLLQNAGYIDIEIKPLGGWDSSFAQILGLWVSRRPMPQFLRLFLQILSWPIFSFLLKTDKTPKIFDNNVIFPSLSGVARKP